MSETIKLPLHHPALRRSQRTKEMLEGYARLAVEQATTELRSELTAALARAEAAESALIRNGYRKSCSIPACNCGDQWNHGGHASERLAEISAALRNSPVEMNGNTLLGGVQELAERTDKAEAERDAALAKLARYETPQPACGRCR